MYERFWHDDHLVCYMVQWLNIADTLYLSQVNQLLKNTCSSESYWKERYLNQWSISDANWKGNDWKRAYMDGSRCQHELWALHSRWVSVTLVPNGNPIPSGDLDPSRLATRVNCHQPGYTLQSERLGLLYRQPADPLPDPDKRLQPVPTTHRTCDHCFEGKIVWNTGLHFVRDIIFSPTLLTVCPPSQCIWLANPSKTTPVAFRFVTSRPDLYAIRPAVGFLLPGQAMEILFYVCGGQWDKAQKCAVLDGNLCPRAFMLQYTTSKNLRRLENPQSFSAFTDILSNPEQASGIRTMDFHVHHTVMPLEVNSNSWENGGEPNIQRSNKVRHQPHVSFRILFRSKLDQLVALDAESLGQKQGLRNRVARWFKAAALAAWILEWTRWAYISAAFFSPKRLAPYCWHTVVGTLPEHSHNPDEIRRQQRESQRLAEIAQLEHRTAFQPVWNFCSAYGGYDVLLHGFMRYAIMWVVMFWTMVPLMFTCLLRYLGIISYYLPGIFSSKEVPWKQKKDPDSDTPEYIIGNLWYCSPYWCGIGFVFLGICWAIVYNLGEKRLKRWMQWMFMAIVAIVSFLLASPEPIFNIATVMLQGAALALGTLLHDAEVGAVANRHSRPNNNNTTGNTLRPGSTNSEGGETAGGGEDQSVAASSSPLLSLNPFSNTSLACPAAAPSASYTAGAVLLGQLIGCSGDVRFAVDLGVVFSWFMGIPRPVHSEGVHWFFILLYLSFSWVVFASVRKGLSRNFKRQRLSVLGFIAVVLIMTAWILLIGRFLLAILLPSSEANRYEIHREANIEENCSILFNTCT